jgi:hypothetical protein
MGFASAFALQATADKSLYPSHALVSLDGSPRTTQPCFTVGHSLLLRGRAASSAGTVASSLR